MGLKKLSSNSLSRAISRSMKTARLPLQWAFIMMAFMMIGLPACSSLRSRDNPPSLDEALALKGESAAVVEKKLGPPADLQKGPRKFWFLTRDSKYHPEAKAELYELLFAGDRLVDVRGAKDFE